MMLVRFGVHVLGACATVAMLASCSSSESDSLNQLPIGGTNPSRGTSAKASPFGADLLYVANEGGRNPNVAILTYPQGMPVASITNIGVPTGICSDTSGNVWVVTKAFHVYEFAHGGTKPIADLTVPNGIRTTGCAVDPTSGNLAVINAGFSSSSTIDIWRGAREGNPRVYRIPLIPWACAYDDRGNLLIDGLQGTTGFFFFGQMTKNHSCQKCQAGCPRRITGRRSMGWQIRRR